MSNEEMLFYSHAAELLQQGKVKQGIPLKWGR